MKRQGKPQEPAICKAGLFLRSEMQKAIIHWMEQAQISKGWCKGTAEACGAVRKAKTQNELQLEQVTQKKEKSFYDIWKESKRKGSAGSQLVGVGWRATWGREALGFYRYLFLETNTTQQTGTQKELAIKTSLILAKFNREITCRDLCNRWMFFLKTQLVYDATEPPPVR